MTISPSYGLAHKPQMIFLATKAVAFLMLNLVGHLLALALQWTKGLSEHISQATQLSPNLIYELK